MAENRYSPNGNYLERNYGVGDVAIWLPDYQSVRGEALYSSQTILNTGGGYADVSTMRTNTWVFTAIDPPCPFEVYSLAFDVVRTGGTATPAIKVVAALYDGFQFNGWQYVPAMPLSSLTPEGEPAARFTYDTGITGSAITMETGERYRIMIRPDPITRNPVILEGGKRYWIAANWNSALSDVQFKVRTPLGLQRFDGPLDFGRTTLQTYSTGMVPPEYPLWRIINPLSGPVDSEINFATSDTLRMLAASIDWAICGRRIR